MRTRLAISADGISKHYRLGGWENEYPTVRESMGRLLRRAHSQSQPGAGSSRDVLWALRDVSFEIPHGETVGIIGSNGAGKSTLLKILSRITRPSAGVARVNGRLASLLEVGTGFHPELTGRENIYLNGAILGMRREEVRRKFDEIVGFAELERFIDTAVKYYSSGMYLRLAFSVAAHLDPEILIIDEVLAVGDAAFQNKCMGKMGGVARTGRTILFVSHNLGAIQALCQRAIYIRNGRAAADGRASDTVGEYLRTLDANGGATDILARSDRIGVGLVKVTGIEISSDGCGPSGVLATGRPARFVFSVDECRIGAGCSFTIYDCRGQPVTDFNSGIHSQEDVKGPSGARQYVCEITELLVVPGRYRLDVALTWGGELQDRVEGAAYFDVEGGEVRGRPVTAESRHGSVCMPHRWVSPS